MSPYIIDDEEVPRVTEKIAVHDCEALGHVERNMPYQRVRTAHVVTVPGTLTHMRIEQRLRKVWDLPGRAYSPDQASLQLMRKLRRFHKEQKAKDPEKVTAWETIVKKANQCFRHFEAFFKDYPVQPVLGMIEHKLHSKQFDYAGTVDLPFEFPLKGRLEKCARLPDDPSGAYTQLLSYDDTKTYFIECGLDEQPSCLDNTCDCKTLRVATLLDWKTSTRKQPSHQQQGAGYHQACEETGLFDQLRQAGYFINWHIWSVLLGEHQLKKLKKLGIPYQLIKYPADFTAFLDCSWTYEREPRCVAMNHKGDIGLKGRCMFCADFLRCPDRVNWSPSHPEEITLTSWTARELQLLRMLVHNKVRSHSQFEELKDKLDGLYETLHETLERKEELDTDVETMLKDYGLETAPVQEWGSGGMPEMGD